MNVRKDLLAFSLAVFLAAGCAGAEAAQQPTGTGPVPDAVYSWNQVVGFGMPDFNDEKTAGKGDAIGGPYRFSLSSGEKVIFIFVVYEKNTYAVYHAKSTLKVLAIGRLEFEEGWPQGLHFFEFYADTGLLGNKQFTGKFRYFDEDSAYSALCRIADLFIEAKANRQCPVEM